MYLRNPFLFLAIVIVLFLIYREYHTRKMVQSFLSPRTKAEEERLAALIQRGDQLVDYVYKNEYPSKEVSQRIHKNWYSLREKKKIGITPPTTDTPGFVINKDVAMQICLTKSPENPHELDDFNTNMFVLIHEIAHLGAIEYDHGPEFLSVFKKLLRASLDIGIWEYTDYGKNPEMYCDYNVNAVPTIPAN